MYYREVLLEDDKSVGDSGTLTVDINIKDPITAFIVRFKAKNGVSDVDEAPPENAVSKIELVDGGQVYWSLTGPQAVAAAVYGLGRWPQCWYDERANNNQRMDFALMFGRYIGDPEFAFDPTRLRNPQLKITWVDTAGYLDASLTIGVIARVMEGVAAPSRCLLWKEIEAWVTASGGVHIVDLPTDYPYRSLLMRPCLVGNVWTDIFSHFKMDCDVGKLLPFDLDAAEFRDITKQLYGPYSHLEFIVATHNEFKEGWMGEIIAVSGGRVSTPAIITLYSAGAWAGYYAYLHDAAGAALADVPVQAYITGFYPHSCILYPFGRPDVPETWFNAPGFGDIDLKLTEGISSAAGSVAIQQPRSLP